MRQLAGASTSLPRIVSHTASAPSATKPASGTIAAAK